MPKTAVVRRPPELDPAALRLVLSGTSCQVDHLQHWRNDERQIVLNQIKPFDFVLVPLRGALGLTARGARTVLRPGSCLAIAAGTEHDGVLPPDAGPLEALTVHCRISAPVAPRLLAAFAAPVLPAAADWRRELSAATALARHDRAAGHEWAALLLRRLLVDAVRAGHALDTRRTHPLVARSAELLDAHPELTVEAVARRCGCSPGRLRQLYATTVGQSPADYRAARRLREACRRLRADDAPIATIATASGFGTQRAMQQAFRKHLGTSPHDYRERGLG